MQVFRSMCQRLLILTTTTGYQTQSFVAAAEKLGLAVVFGSDRCRRLEDPWRDHALPLRFEDPEDSAARIAAHARSSPVDGIVSLGDRPSPTAARACQALGLPGHPPEAAEICRDKYRSRERLAAAGLAVPAFVRFPLTADPAQILESGQVPFGFPWVLKPLSLSASRGVIRADDASQFIAAFERIRALLSSPDVRALREGLSNFLQVERYLEGTEVAIEGLMEGGQLKILAIFDKPDPLDGPFFEETIYVTPSRLPAEVQTTMAAVLARAVEALGLWHGPLHAELRLTPGSLATGDPAGMFVLEVAARSIGGLCSRALRFVSPTRDDAFSLEELLIRLALGEDVRDAQRESRASGVMMIPIPAAGIYQGVERTEAARTTPGVDDLIITIKPGEKLVPLPEGASYLGFIFARGDSPAYVEDALRKSHSELRFELSPVLPVIGRR